ncbi:MAG: Ig-like domain-containing protein [Bifidobacteriaceae bacterium]|nr:Ig-like domain-containing protein [Bifidobacteriaceae bacterium]
MPPGTVVTVTDAGGATLCTSPVAADSTWSCNSNRPLVEGETITASVTDAAGNTASEPAIVDDGTTPTITFDPQPTTDSPTVGGDVTDEGAPLANAPVSVTDDTGAELCHATTGTDGSWSCTPNRALEPGEVLTATTHDPAGNQATVDSSPVVDDTDPEITVAPAPNEDSLEVAGTVTDQGEPLAGAPVTVTDAGGATLCTATTQADGSWSCDASRDLVPGETITAATRDPAGNTDSVDAVVQSGVDTEDPVVTISPAPVTGDPTIEGTVTDNGAPMAPGTEVVVTDSTGAELCTAHTAADGSWSCDSGRPLVEGETITATATDPAGNEGTDTATVGDGLPPVITIDPAPKSGDDTTVAGTVTDGGSPLADAPVEVKDSANNTLCVATTGTDGSWSCTANRELVEGETITAETQDDAGNPADDSVTVGDGTGPDITFDPQPSSDDTSVGGTVEDDGAPLGGAPVTVTDDAGTTLCTTTSNLDGTWSCQPNRDLEPGEVITASTEDNAGNPASVDSSPVADTTDPVVTFSPAPKDGDTSVGGTATDQGDPLPNAPVSVTDDTGAELCHTTTNADGTWSCTPNRPIEEDEVITATVTDPAGNEGTADATVGPADDTTDPVITIAPTPKDGETTVAGTVTDSGSPLPNAPVKVTDAGGATLCDTTTAPDGSWSCTVNRPLVEGEQIKASTEDPAGNTDEDTVTVAAADDTEDPVVTITPTPKEGDNTISGTLTDNGAPLPAGTAVVVTDDTDTELCTAHTLADGSWSCQPNRPLEEGEEITATATDPAGNTGSDTATVGPGDDDEDPVITFSPAPKEGDTTVGGLVTDNGAPLGGATVNVTGPGGTPVCTATTNPDGTWSCTPSPAIEEGDVLTATVQDPSGNEGTATATVLPEDDTTAPVITITPEPATGDTTVEGTVTDSGSPLPDATVTVTDAGGAELCHTTTNADGTWSCTVGRDLVEGETITASTSDPAGNPASDTATVADGTPPVLTITPDPKTGTDTTVAGTVTDDGAPLGGASVTVTDDTGATLCTTTTAPDGTWSCQANRPLVEGETIYAETEDDNGNVGEDDATVVDGTAPQIAIAPAPKVGDPAVTGTLSDDGAPLAGTPVTVTDAGGTTLCTAYTQGDGSWSCPPNRALVQDEVLTATASDPAGNPATATATVQPAVDTTDPVVTFDPAPAAGDTTVGGTVTDSGSPLPNAPVTVTDDTGATLCSTNTNADGTWSCTTRPLVAGEDITATATDPAGNEGTAEATVAVGTDTNPPVIAITNQPKSGDDRAVAGTVTDEGTPLGDAPVRVTDAGGAQLCTAVTASDGSWSCTTSRPLVEDEVITATTQDVAGNPASTTATVVDGTDPEIIIAPTPREGDDEITGTVTDDGAPLANAPVSVTDDTGAELCHTTTNSDGTWSCQPNRPIEEGEVITATTEDPQGNEDTVTVTVGSEVDTTPPVIQITPQPTTGSTTIAGVVTDEGAPLPAAPVLVMDGNGLPLCSANTDAEGYWHCNSDRPLEEGETINASTRDEAGNEANVLATVADGTDPVVTITPAPKSGDDPTIAGTVTDDGAPLANAPVTVTDDTGTELCHTTTALDGSWSCDSVRPLEEGEVVTATAEDPAGNEGSGTATVGDGTGPDITFDPQPATGDPTVGGTVEDDGAPLPGATVTVKDDAGATLCVAVTGTDGTWSCTLNRPLEEGEVITASTVDDAGNPASVDSQPVSDGSDPVVTIAPAPKEGDDTIGGTVTDDGNPRAGVPVVVTDDTGTELCQATTTASGAWSCQPNRPLEEGEVITATATDPSGNEGTTTATVGPEDDTTAPVIEITPEPETGSRALAGTVTDNGSPLPNAIVHVKDAGGAELCTATTSSTGTWACTANRDLVEGETITASTTDPAGNPASDTATVADGIDPVLEIAPAPKEGDEEITGTLTDDGDPLPGTVVTVTDDAGTELCTATTDADGEWSCEPNRPLEEGETIHASAQDPAGNLATDAVTVLPADDTTAPVLTITPEPATGSPAIAGTLTDSGSPLPGTPVTVKDAGGTTLCTAYTQGDGSWSCNSNRPLVEGETVTASAADPSGNPASDDATVGDGQPPVMVITETPTSGEDPVIGGRVTDEGEPLANAPVTVKDDAGTTLCVATTGTDGTWSCEPNRPLEEGEEITATVTDPAGNPGTGTATVGDGTPPVVVVDDPATGDTSVGGTVTDDGAPLPNAPVRVTDEDGNTLCTAVTDSAGHWSCTPNRPLEEGEEITATATDPAGNTGSGTSEPVSDGTDPVVAITQQPTSGDDPVIGGTVTDGGEPLANAPVVVTDEDGEELCHTTTGPDGTWSCEPNRPLEEGEILTATATDPEGNEGSVDSNPVGDGTPPVVTVDDPATGDDTVGGTVTDDGEPLPNAPVRVTDEDGETLCTAVTDSSGHWSCTPNRPLEEGEEITATATDPAGNTGSGTSEPVGDGTGPEVTLTEQPTSGDDPVIGGTVTDGGEPLPNAPVVVTDEDGEELCHTTTGPDGTWSCEPNRPLEEGEILTATATDPAGNEGSVDSDPVGDGTEPEVTVDDPATGDTSIGGTVTDDGEPLPNAPVRVTDEDGETLCTAVTDSSGHWSCQPNRPLEEGEEITATATDPAGNTGSGTSEPVADGIDPVVTIDPPSNDSPTISGTVTDDGEPLPGVPVTVTDEDGETLCTATTGSDGTWSCDSSRPLEDGEEITASTTDPAGNPGTGTATVGDETEPEVTVNPPQKGDTTASGRVTDDGQPAAGFPVVVKDATGDPLCQTTTNADGTFSCNLKRPLGENEVITVEATDPETGKKGDTQASTPNVPPVITVDPVDVGDTTVTGTVTDDGEPLPGVPVKVKDKNGNTLCETTTDDDGKFECGPTKRPLGDNEQITASTSDPAGNPKEVTVNTPNVPPVVDVDPTKKGDTTVTGTVTDDGGPLPNAPVTVQDKDGNTLCTTTTDKDGKFSCDVSRPLVDNEPLTVTADNPNDNLPAGTASPVVGQSGSGSTPTPSGPADDGDDADKPSVWVKEATRYRGESQEVNGLNFEPGEKVTGVVHSTPIQLGTATADANGKVVFAAFTIPADFEYGTHTVTLTGETSGAATGTFRVLEKVGSSSPLPITGANATVPIAVSASLATLVGIGFVLMARRRRRSEETVATR